MARGRRLVVPQGLDVRPTSDRVREATFNALGSLDAVVDARVLDLFAGTGALGIEALSRGASEAVFVEPARQAIEALRTNLDSLAMAERSRVRSTTADVYLAGSVDLDAPFDLVLCDPPYRYDEWPALLGAVAPILSPDAWVVIESDRSVELPEGWEVAREKAYGGTVVGVARLTTIHDETGPARSHP